MTKTMHHRFDGGRAARLCGLACVLAAAAAGFLFTKTCARVVGGASAARAAATTAPPAQEDGRLDIRLRSFTPNASGRLTIEPSAGGGRGRLTALNLPDPQTLSSGATTYVVWVTSGGRIVNVGELRRDERGNGGLAFEHPADFDRYSVIVTAEPNATPERPGAPVLSTHANEAVAVYPPPPANDTAAATTPAPSTATTPAPAAATTPTRAAAAPPAPPVPRVERNTRPRRLGGDFYAEVDDALVAQGGGRVLEMEGGRDTPQARGSARAATHTGSAYVRANFRGVPLPSIVGASTYVLWAIVPADGRIVYMGSLPVTDDLNHAEIYVRTAGFGTDTFDLFVTAERGRPVPAPSDQRMLTPKLARVIVK